MRYGARTRVSDLVSEFGISTPNLSWWNNIPVDVQNASANATSSATPNTKGAWTEIVASSSNYADGLWVRFISSTGNAATNTALLDIGLGASGSEVTIIENIAVGYAGGVIQSGGYQHNYVFFPVSIPSGSRIAIRSQGAVVSGVMQIKLWLTRQSTYENLIAVDTFGANTATSSGINLPTTNSYVEFVASTSYAYSGFVILLAGTGNAFNNADHLVTIAIGAAGSDVDLFSRGFRTGNQEGQTTESPLNIGGSFVPAGSRISLKTSVGSNYANYIIYGIRA